MISEEFLLEQIQKTEEYKKMNEEERELFYEQYYSGVINNTHHKVLTEVNSKKLKVL